jgi:hypothetical protein
VLPFGFFPIPAEEIVHSLSTTWSKHTVNFMRHA